MKNFWLMTMTDARQQQLDQPHGHVVARRTSGGSGQPHIMWPMEKYISTSRKPSDADQPPLELGRFVVGQCVQRSAGAALRRARRLRRLAP